MIKLTFKAIVTLAVALMLVSCLGENSQKNSTSDAYAYITRSGTGKKVAYTSFSPANMIYSDFFESQDLQYGQFYQIGYEVNTKDGATDGFYNANSVYFAQKGTRPIPMTVLSTPQTLPTYPNSSYPQAHEIYPTAIGVPFYDPQDLLCDNFVIRFICQIDETEIEGMTPDRIKVLASLVDDNQFVDNKQEEQNVKQRLDPSKKRINLTLIKEGESTSTATSTMKTYEGVTVVNMSELRSLFKRTELEQVEGYEYTIGIFEFQYTKDLGKDKTETAYLGSLNIISSNYRPAIFSGATFGMFIK